MRSVALAFDADTNAGLLHFDRRDSAVGDFVDQLQNLFERQMYASVELIAQRVPGPGKLKARAAVVSVRPHHKQEVVVAGHG